MTPPPSSTATLAKAPRRKSEIPWSTEKSSELYGVETWGHGFFGVNKNGHVTVRLEGACTSCSVNQMTLRAGVETTIKKFAPQIETVVNIL